MKIAYLGAGSWGYALASLLSGKGYDVVLWTTDPTLAKNLTLKKEHPRLPSHHFKGNLLITTNLEEALLNAEMIVESVTAAGIRPVFEQVKATSHTKSPIILTSKGIEQGSGLILSDVIIETLGAEAKMLVGSISGPSYAAEVIQNLPTSVVGSAYDETLMHLICSTFTTDTFRVYPNGDMQGVAYGGALKNVIAIACGIAEGLSLGYSARAALMTRGLHEMRKLAVTMGAKAETLYGLSGMGDLCVTCSSMLSRNFRFGVLLAQGMTPKEATQHIGMVIEGAYTSVSALELSKQQNVPMPITEVIHHIINEGLKPKDAVPLLMKRTIKEEHL